MTRYFTNLILISAALLLSITSVLAGTRDEQLTRVTVYAHTLDGKPAYTYTIENTGNNPILGFSVGFDHYTGTSELSGVHPHEIISPDSWQSRIISLEESPYYEVRWEPIQGTDSLKPGSTLTGFTIIMDSPNNNLLNGHWTAIINGPPTYTSSRLEVLDGPPDDLDLIPPVISIEVDPNIIWPPNNKLVTITASITVSDNRDANPSVSLVSLTCNECDVNEDIQDAETGTSDFSFSLRAARSGKEKSGRTYIVVYSATDSAGNSSTASANITVPHDQRKE